MSRKFTIQEIKNYLMKADSLGDAVYFLNERKIDEANQPEEPEELDDEDDEISSWDRVMGQDND